MPILPAEPDLYPDNLWAETVVGPKDEAAPTRTWWCLHTRPRQEKAVVRELRTQRVSYYLPQIVHEDRTPQGRKTRSVLPLFTSYVFLRGSAHERLLALKSNRLVRVLDVIDQDALERDLRQIHRMATSGLALVAEPSPPVGARVRILNGPLTGIEGRVIKRGKLDQFIALVRFLGSGASVELQDWQVEEIPDH